MELTPFLVRFECYFICSLRGIFMASQNRCVLEYAQPLRGRARFDDAKGLSGYLLAAECLGLTLNYVATGRRDKTKDLVLQIGWH